MSSSIPVLAVIGHKKSGKTTVIERLVSEFRSKGLRVAAAKHISEKGFSMDAQGKDTWRYSAAGADPVIAVTETESIVKAKDGMGKVSLDRMLKLAGDNGADILTLEGFSSLVLEDRRVGKIACVRNREEYEEFKKKTQGEALAYCSFEPLGEPVLNIERSLQAIAEKAAEFIEKRRRIGQILSQLAGLDCAKCGKATCEELAEAIYEGQASWDDCLPLRLKPELKTRITVDDSEVPLQPFVSEIVRKTILGMVSALKGVSLEGQEEVKVSISRPRIS